MYDHNVYGFGLNILSALINAGKISNAHEAAAAMDVLCAKGQEILHGAKAEAGKVQQEPAVPIRKSVTPDYIVCLEDGRKMKMLKRHLAKLGMTPDQYRAKWGLPADYPMTAPNYAEKRSGLAKANGLGKR